MARKHYDGTPADSDWVDPFLEKGGNPSTWSSMPSLGLASRQLKRGAKQAAKDGGLKKISGNPETKTVGTTKKGRTNTVSTIISKSKSNSKTSNSTSKSTSSTSVSRKPKTVNLRSTKTKVTRTKKK